MGSNGTKYVTIYFTTDTYSGVSFWYYDGSKIDKATINTNESIYHRGNGEYYYGEISLPIVYGDRMSIKLSYKYNLYSLFGKLEPNEYDEISKKYTYFVSKGTYKIVPYNYLV